jgi:DNA-directed RNA polymerase subunit RPC12/RpoP
MAVDRDVTAPCAGNPRLWFSKATAEIQLAKEVCGRCPVLDRCGEIASAQALMEGVYAGYNAADPNERAELKSRFGSARTRNSRAKTRRTVVRETYECTKCGDRFETTIVPADPVQCTPCRNRLVDPGPTQAHLERLRATGETWQSISDRAGLSVNTVWGIRNADKWIKQSSQAAIAALDPLDTQEAK